jgi:hypothetical protein
MVVCVAEEQGVLVLLLFELRYGITERSILLKCKPSLNQTSYFLDRT